jgi:uncharacterized protein
MDTPLPHASQADLSRPQGVSYRLLSLRFCSYTYGTTEGWLVPEWTWDPNKDALNRQNHQGLSLTAGALVLDGDPLALSRPDPHPDGDRWQTVGSAGGVVVLFVVHTEPVEQEDGHEVGRIISVRKAKPHERRAYEEGTF